MIRRHENKDSWKAGALAIAVHVVLLGGMLVSVNWKAAHPVMNVTEVELWDKLPSAKTISKPEPKPAPVIEEKPIVEEKPKVEPKPVLKTEPRPEEPKVDIALEQKKKELALKEKLEVEKQKKDALLEKIKLEAREDELLEKKQAQKQKDDLKKLQQDALSEENSASEKQANAASSAANASVIGEYTDKIKAKIRGNVNKTLCGDGNPELRFEIGLLPTGELSGTPKLTKSSGNEACDDAVERAIIASQPLPLPSDAAIYRQFRNLNLKFKPNE